MIKDVIIHKKESLVDRLLDCKSRDTGGTSNSGHQNAIRRWTQSLKALQSGQCANTYAIEHPVSMDDGSAACDKALGEMTPLLLGASYLWGLSVTAKHSLPHSDVRIVGPGNHWPRERSMGSGNPVVAMQNELVAVLEAFVGAWSGPGQSEKALLLIHHWLDCLACWQKARPLAPSSESSRPRRPLSFAGSSASGNTDSRDWNLSSRPKT
jgi:hypothetical protein